MTHVLCTAAASASPDSGSVMSCVVCGRVRELDGRGFPLEAGSTVRARCGHDFCSECLLDRISGSAPYAYECEQAGYVQSVGAFAILRKIGDGSEPFTTECVWGRKLVVGIECLEAPPLEAVMVRE